MGRRVRNNGRTDQGHTLFPLRCDGWTGDCYRSDISRTVRCASWYGNLDNRIAAFYRHTLAGSFVMAAQLPLKFTAGQISQFVASTDSIPVTVGGTGVVALSDILGTTNQISVASGAARVIGGNVTLSTPQNIDTAATVTFGTVTTSSATTTQLTAGSTGSNQIGRAS